MATKRFVNNTEFALTVIFYPRLGQAVSPNGTPTAPVTLASRETKFISFPENELNAIRISWLDAGTRCVSEQEVVEKGSWWDQTINDHDMIIVESVSRDDIKGVVYHDASLQN